jgi:restriction system protein
MAIPQFKYFLLPVLSCYADGSEHSVGELITRLGDHFSLPESDRAEMLDSGIQTRLHNRVAWAHSYLSKARLIDRVGTSRYRVTDRGKELLTNPPDVLTPAYLSDRYPEFAAFVTPKQKSSNEPSLSTEREDEATPEEQLESAYKSLRTDLAQRLIDQVKRCSPAFFERLVVDLLVAMGYGGSRADAGKAVGQSGDGGIDGIIKEDRLGLDIVYIQAKRWEGNVGRPHVQAFVGALAGRQASKGVMITTSKFTDDAIRYANSVQQKIVLIDGDSVSNYMIDFDVGVTTSANFVVKKLDSDYFEQS